MRKLYLALLMSGLIGSVSAQCPTHISTFPYTQDFEGAHGWTTGGNSGTWVLGTPAKPVIQGAASGTKAWVTRSLTANYIDMDSGWVQSPCFNLSALSNPVVDLKIWYRTEASFDGSNLQYSLNGGSTWFDVGTISSGRNWYNDNTVSGLQWTGSQSGWTAKSPQGGTGYVLAKHDLTAIAGQPSVKFRMTWGADQSLVDEGVAFDDFRIYQKPASDLSLAGFVIPKTAAGSCNLPSNQAITIDVTNEGAAAQSGIPVSYTINGGTPVTAFLPGVLNPNQTATYTFTQRANLSTPNTTYVICVSVNKTGDANAGNNSICTTVKNQYMTVGQLENFDSFGLCGNTQNVSPPNTECNDNLQNGWLNAQDDQFNWSTGNGNTPSVDTGPSGDHTSATGGNNGTGNYMYTEASDAASNFNKLMHLESPCINLQGVSNPGVSFWYHMYGSAIGTLSVDVFSNGAWVLDVLTLSGSVQSSEGDPFFQAIVPLNQFAGQIVKVRFRGQTGPDFTSDIAIDDFEVTGSAASIADAGISAITGLASGCNLSAATQICVTVNNFGTSAVTNLPVSYTINGGTPVTATIPGPIAAGATATYCFTQTANLSAAGTYNIVATSALTGDATPGNNSSTVSVTSTVTAAPVISPSVPSTVCSNASPVTLSGTPATGTFSGPGVTGTTFNPTTAGAGTHTITYSVTANGCTGTSTKTITVTAAPTPGTIGGLSNTCNTAPVQSLTGTPSGGVFSGPGVSGNIFNPATAGNGTHTISYTRTSGGCSSVTTQQVTITSPGTASITNLSAYCSNAGIVPLAGAPSGGTFTVNGTAATTLNTATPGTYNVVYTTGGGACGGTATKTITVTAAPVIGNFANTAACSNAGDITFAATPAGGTYSGPGVTGSTFNPNAAGVVVGANQITYEVTQGGCTTTKNITITVTAAPTITGLTDTTICASGGSITLSASPAGGVFTGTGVTGTTFTPTANGTFKVFYLVSNASGCAAADSAEITVTSPQAVNIATPNTTLCSNDAPVTLSATPAGGGFIGNGVNGNVYTPSAAGSDTLTYVFTDTNTGCSSSAYIVMTVNAAPTVTMAAIGSVCSNDAPIALSATPAGGTFSGTGVTGSNFDPSLAGADSVTYTYTDPVTNCSATALSVATVKVAPSSTFNYNPVGVTGTTWKFQASPPTPTAIYSWNFGDGSPTVGTVSPPAHTFPSIGSYNVTLVVTRNGCVDSTTITIAVTSVREDLTQGVELYPNPAKGQVVVELAKAGVHQLEVYNIQGQRVLMQTLTPQSKQLLDVSTLAAGAYVVRITGDHTNFIKQLVIEQ